MNRRIVLVDDEVQNPLDYVSRGLGDEIFSVNNLETLEPDVLKSTLSLGPGDAAMLVGSRAFEKLKEFYHFGIRGENYWDCSQLNRLGIEGGAFVRVIHESDIPSPEVIRFFMSPGFCEKRTFPNYKYKIVKTYKDAKPLLKYFLNLPVGTDMGFDYEGSGMAFEKDFCITGASLALAYSNAQRAVFFSFQDIRKNDTPEDYELFKKDFAAILYKHQKHLWVFNLSYETQVTWREFGIECEFSDASVYNVLDGLHSKNFSLKWTAQRLLGGGDIYHLPGVYEGPGLEPWDTDFDRLEDLFTRLYYVDTYTKGKKKPTGRCIKCSEYDFQIQNEWFEICRMYPEYVDEFKSLVLENFGNPFLNMPSDILGKYCCLDSFYTVLIHLENKNRYTDLCRETFLNNQRIYSRNSRAGLYTDDEYIEEYSKYAKKMMLWGILYMASYRCYMKIQKHTPKAAKIDKYPEMAKILLEKNEFYQGNTQDIAKNILAQNVDTTDCYDTGLDEGGMVFKYGQKFTAGFIQIVKDSMTEIKFKGKIDSTIARKKKILGVVAGKLTTFLGIDKIKLNNKHVELEKLLYYQRAYKNLQNTWAQIPDMMNIPEYIVWEKKKLPIEEVTRTIMENYYRCTSPVDNEILEKELITRFKGETIFLATIMRDVNKLPAEKRYYQNLGITTPEDAYNHFYQNYNIFYNNFDQRTNVCLWPQNIQEVYPREIWYLANEHALDPMCDRMRDIWGDWKGWNVQEDYFNDKVNSERLLMGEPWNEADLGLPTFTLMRKLLINVLLYKKYNKILSTYLGGLFVNGSRYVIETPQLIPTRNAEPDEPGAVKKLFTKYDVMHKETKRSSSGYHTIPSHMDAKKSITCPVLNTPGSRTGRTATLLSYFDISSAEVRTLAASSGDKNLNHLFETGQDIYIYTAKSMLGEDKWNSFDKSEKKKWRKVFKVVYLAVAYRMSAKTLGQNLNVPEAEAQGYIDSLFGQFPDLEKFIKENSEYPMQHNGYINTELGDALRCTAYRFLYKDDPYRKGQKKIDNRIVSKLSSAGINYRIQSFSAVSLASGFEHVIQKSLEDNMLIRNVIVVHDSCENLVNINYLFGIKQYYDEHFMKYAKDQYGVLFKYDLEIGLNYGEMMGVKPIDNNTIEITGSGSVIQGLLWKLDNESDLSVITDIPREEIIPQMEPNPIIKFITEKQCCMDHDYSNYTVRLTKLG